MKKPMSFSIEEDLQKVFKELCEDLNINRSKWLEKQMYKFIKVGETK